MAAPHTPPASSFAEAPPAEVSQNETSKARHDYSAVTEDPSALETPTPKEAHPGWRQLDRRKVVGGFVILMAALVVVMYASSQMGRGGGEETQVDIEAPEEARPTSRQETEGLLKALERSARERGTSQRSARQRNGRQTNQAGGQAATGGQTAAERLLGGILLETPGQAARQGAAAGSGRAQAGLDSLQRVLRRQLAGLSASAGRASSGPLPGQGRYQAMLGGPVGEVGGPGRSQPSYNSYGTLGRPRGPAAEPPPGVTAKPIVYKAESSKAEAAPGGQAPGTGGASSYLRMPGRQTAGYTGRSTAAAAPLAGPRAAGISTAGIPAAGTRAVGISRAPFAKRASAPLRPMPPASPFVLRAGTTIPAILATAVSSDLPGYVSARITRDVFDSATQQHLLIPKGSVLQGHYDAQVRTGQKRLALVWERLVLPDGSTLALPTFEAKDGQGRAGVPGEVDNHYWRIFGGALLTGLAGAAVRLATYDTEGGLFRRPSPTAIAGGAAAGEMGEAADEMLQRQINIAPTIRLEAGDPVTVYVSRRITFDGPYRPYDGFSPGR